jgi:hypothetical protein
MLAIFIKSTLIWSKAINSKKLTQQETTMKKLTLFTTAVIIAACSAAQAVEAPSLGDRIKMNWDHRADRNAWGDRYRAQSEVAPAAADDRARMRGDDMKNDGTMHNDKHKAHKMTAAEKAEWDKMTPEQRAARKADMKAKHKAKMDSMTPAERAKWEAKKKEMKNRGNM